MTDGVWVELCEGPLHGLCYALPHNDATREIQTRGGVYGVLHCWEWRGVVHLLYGHIV